VTIFFCHTDLLRLMLQQVRESELEEEKAVLVRQMDELRGEVARLSSEKESLRDVSMSAISLVTQPALH